MGKALNLKEGNCITNQPKDLMGQCKSNLNRKQIHATATITTV